MNNNINNKNYNEKEHCKCCKFRTKSDESLPKCKYYPNCTKLDCKFKHIND